MSKFSSRVIWFILVSVCFVKGSTENVESRESYLQETEEAAYEKLKIIESGLKANVENLIRQMLPKVIRYSSEIELSGECMGSLLKTAFGLRDLKLWAVQLVESFGIPGGGILSGTAASFGSYKQCVEVVIGGGAQRTSYSGDDKPPVTGQYCLMSIRPPIPPRPRRIRFLENVFPHINATFQTEIMNRLKELLFNSYEAPYKIGICLPSSCSQDEISKLLQPMSKEIGLYIDVELCQVKETFKMDTLQISIAIFLVFLMLVNAVATAIDEIHISKSKNSNKKNVPTGCVYDIVRCFSLRRNFELFLKMRPPERKALDCMRGMKYFSVTWIVLGHTYLLYIKSQSREAIHGRFIIEDFMSHSVSSSMLSLESFMFINAVLLAYTMVKNYDVDQVFQPFCHLIKRAIRLIPGILLMSGFIILVPLMGSGPEYRGAMKHHSQMCRDNWWTNIIFISNFIKYDEMCLANSWYYSADFQCLFLALLYLYLLFKTKILGRLFLAFLAIFAIISTGGITYFFQFPPTFLTLVVDDKYFAEYVNGVYFLPNVHFGVYAAGLLLGTLLARNPNFKLSPKVQVFGWLLATSAALVSVYGLFPWNNGAPFNAAEAVSFAAMQRTLFAVSLAWIVLTCYCGSGGIVNYIISFPIFQPLMRLTNLIYLFHTLLIIYTTNMNQGSVDFNHFTKLFQFIGIFAVSHGVAFFLRMTFESPLIRLQNIVFAGLSNIRRKRKKSVMLPPNLDEKRASTTSSYI